jgi:transcriptional regulator with XRE-family HTH domain
MTETLTLSLGESLRIMRERAGFSQTQLAGYLELGRTSIIRYEADTAVPKWKDVDAWCRICDHDPQIVRELWESRRLFGCTPGHGPPDDRRYLQLSFTGGLNGSKDSPHVTNPEAA